MRPPALALVCLVILSLPQVAGSSEEWIRVRHRQFPISFTVPAESSLQRLGVFSLARVHDTEGQRIEVDFFGVRPIRAGRSAVQFGFYWVTDAVRGADPDELAGLPDRIGQPERVRAFLRGALFGRLEVASQDRGRAFVDGHLARRTGLSRTVARGTADERRIEGEVALIPVSPTVALVAIVRFDEEATEAEREQIFGRVLDSLELGSTGRGGSIEASAGAPAALLRVLAARAGA